MALPRLAVIIPARGGSKRVPGKNMKPCAGKPLLAWTIDHFWDCLPRLAELVDPGVIVSTDDPEIAAYAKEAGASVIDRPAELATDHAMTVDVIAHAVKQLDVFPKARPDLVAVLQPTVPARAGGLLTDCVRLLLETDAASVHTAYPLHFVWWKESPTYAYQTDTGRPDFPQWRSQCPRRPRRQDMESREMMYAEDGAVFLARAALIREHGRYLADPRKGEHAEVFETVRTVDIDDPVDFAVAEALLTYREVIAHGDVAGDRQFRMVVPE